jgi:hypothetical protein
LLVVNDTFKVIEMAAKKMPKKEALKDKSKHTTITCFGPELAKKVHKDRSGTGNCRPKGQPKSNVMDDNELELEILARASSQDALATHRCGRNFAWQQQRA